MQENYSVQYIKGVGPKTAKVLKKLGIQTVSDLITYFPKEYQDRSQLKQIAEVKFGERETIQGKVELTDVIRIGKDLSIFKAAISDKTGIIYATWIRRISRRYDVFATLNKLIQPNREIIITGKVENNWGNREISVEDYEFLTGSDDDLIHTKRIVPIYPLTEGITNRFLRTIIKFSLDKFLKNTTDILSDEIKNRQKLLNYREALLNIHFPSDFDKKDKARRRLAFDEFFLIETALSISKRNTKETEKKFSYKIKKALLTKFKENLPFNFTQSQIKVINEVFRDMLLPHPMNRLIQGDVGSGKTVVALSAMLLAVENNYQSCIMVPTEILAEQHYYTIKNLIGGLSVNVELLTGSFTKRTKGKILRNIESGITNIVIGTHAVIEKNIRFKNLSLVVIDEQHRFGVLQRETLRKKTFAPDVLVMTATPIPRTLSLTVYGDLDISVISELPPGRKKIQTYYYDEKTAYNFVKEQIKKNHQIYIVYPLIDESDKVELKSVIQQAEKLKKEEFKDFKVGILHGKLTPKEKQYIMADFINRDFDILISTTVIEVGIDIPQVNTIVIEDAQRYGLATLHQLRGRVGRGEEESYCILVGEPKTEEARRRFNIMLNTTDGFKIAEEDLSIRGPGEFFGTRQSGLPELKLGNLVSDFEIIKDAKETAEELVGKNPMLDKYPFIRETLKQKFGDKIKLVKIG